MSIITELFPSDLLEAKDVISIEPFGSGHIHDTFLVKTRRKVDYILQKINHLIFANVPALQQNIEKVLDYLEIQKHNADTFLKMLQLKGGKTYVLDNEGNYWRAFIFIPGSKTYDKVTSANLANEAGNAYGSFLNLLHDFPVASLYETIPDFHCLNSRMIQFEESIKNDVKNRSNGLKKELEFVRARSPKMKRILELGQEKKIPLRITHNDTKINNVLFDQNDKAICVIDLDTVMPGYIHYDFGDAIRTGASSADEDEKDFRKMFINLELFEAFSRGFLEQTNNSLNQTEIDELYLAPQLLTFTIALRFLTDYLNGDVYFRVEHQDHNLQRWFSQKKLLLSMEENEAEMRRIIENIVKSLKRQK